MRLLLIPLIFIAAASCDNKSATRAGDSLASGNILLKIQQSGELIVVTRSGPATFYYTQGEHAPAGLEYELAKRFSRFLGVRLRLETASHPSAVLSRLSRGEAHLAAGVSITEQRRELARFGPTYQTVVQQLVYRSGTPAPSDFNDLRNGRLVIPADSSYRHSLQQFQQDYPQLSWIESYGAQNANLLTHVWEKSIDYTVVDSNELAVMHHYYPELRVAFSLGEPKPVAWAFAPGEDDSLIQAATQFFSQLRESGELENLKERYFDHVEDFDYVDTRRFMASIEKRLPTYRHLFEQAEQRSGLDWKLLAAMGYQESHWKRRAVSPTGVRGIMMLTRVTARQLNIKNRVDPEQSIDGGARYLAHLKSRLSKQVAEPDRTWLAVAAYNVGMGHLNDARKITRQHGGNPNRWMDVKRHLPLLAQQKWYRKTRYGHARGQEPVDYVTNIRRYYHILTWMVQQEKQRQAASPLPTMEAKGQPAPLRKVSLKVSAHGRHTDRT